MSGMALQFAAQSLQLPHLFPRNDSQLHQRSVLHQNGMPLAHQEAIPVRIVESFGIEAHLPEVQSCHNLGQRTRTTQVPRLADTNHLHDVSSQVPCDLLDSLNLVGLCHPSSSGQDSTLSRSFCSASRPATDNTDPGVDCLFATDKCSSANRPLGVIKVTCEAIYWAGRGLRATQPCSLIETHKLEPHTRRPGCYKVMCPKTNRIMRRKPMLRKSRRACAGAGCT